MWELSKFWTDPHRKKPSSVVIWLFQKCYGNMSEGFPVLEKSWNLIKFNHFFKSPGKMVQDQISSAFGIIALHCRDSGVQCLISENWNIVDGGHAIIIIIITWNLPENPIKSWNFAKVEKWKHYLDSLISGTEHQLAMDMLSTMSTDDNRNIVRQVGCMVIGTREVGHTTIWNMNWCVTTVSSKS